MVDNPNALWYVSSRNANHANAGAARGQRGRAGRKKEEGRMQNEVPGGAVAAIAGACGERSRGRDGGGRMWKCSLMFAYVRRCSLMFALLEKNDRGGGW